MICIGSLLLVIVVTISGLQTITSLQCDGPVKAPCCKHLGWTWSLEFVYSFLFCIEKNRLSWAFFNDYVGGTSWHV